MTSRLEFWNVFANDLDAVAQGEPLVRIESNRRIQRRMSDCNAGSRRNDPSDVLVMAIPSSTRNGSRIGMWCRLGLVWD